MTGARDSGLNDVCGLLAHQASELGCDRVLRGITAKRQSRDSDNDQQDRGD